MKTILIKNASVIATQDEKRRKLFGKDILIEGRKIKKIGRLNERADRVIDASGMAVLPGLVNTHHHLFQNLTRSMSEVQNKKLFGWLNFLYGIWRHIDEEAVDISTRLGAAELLLTGCTTTADHLYLFPGSLKNSFMDIEIKAASEMGIRFHPSRGSMSAGKSSGGLPPDYVVQDTDEILKESERIIDTYHDGGELSMCRVVLAPCSPFSVDESMMKMTRELARKKGVFMHTHLAETLDEEKYCLELKGVRPFSYMKKLGWLGKDVWFAHCVHLNDREIKELARSGSGVSHCPTSNMRLASGIAPVRKMLDMGVGVSLAVDGSSSNDTSDMLGEVRMAMLAGRLKSGVDSMSADDVIYMATKGGARVLGREDIGSIEEGKAADLALFNVNRIDFAGSIHDYIAALVFCGISHVAHTVIVNGEIRVRNSKLTGVDEKELTLKANKVSKKLRARAGID